MRRNTLISLIGPLIMLAAGLAFAVGDLTTLDLGVFHNMGPGTSPMLVGGILLVRSLMGVVRSVKTPVAVRRKGPISGRLLFVEGLGMPFVAVRWP